MTMAWLPGGIMCAVLALAPGCKKSAAGAADVDGSSDAVIERAPVLCSELDAGAIAPEALDAASDAGGLALPSTTDELGPNTAASKTTSSLGRVNIYEVTSSSWLRRVEIYLRAGLDHTRLTLAVHESTGRDSAFKKLLDVQLDFATCEGWASSGALELPLEAGRFYAIGFDPNQVVTPFVSADSDVLPIDGAFGRLVASKTSPSVSVSSLTWDKSSDKEFNRQRLTTSPREASDSGVATDAAVTTDGAIGGEVRDAASKS